MKLQRKHIASEYADSDGYWIDLAPGWKSMLDPIGNEHGIHEETKKECYMVGVMRCDCSDCLDD